MNRTVDDIIRDVAARLTALPRTRLAVFFAFCTERLLPLYDVFVEREGWGDSVKVHKALDESWKCLEGSELACQGLLARVGEIEALTPHSDDFESIETTFAQDTCSCLDSTLRSAAGDVVDPLAVSCVFEALRIGITYARTGYIDLGSGEEAERFEELLGKHPRIVGEFAEQAELIRQLEQVEEIDAQAIVRIRDTARMKAWRLDEIVAA